LGSEIGAPQCDLVAVAEEFGDQERGDLGDEILESGVPGAKQVNVQFAHVLNHVATQQLPANAAACHRPRRKYGGRGPSRS
jgi:hypothetical protein